MTLKAVVFDFDGVLAESVSVKCEAFAQLFECEGPGIVEQVVAHHRAHGGMSRFEKFRFYHQEFLCRPLSEARMEELCKQFSDLVVDGVIRSPWVSGAREALEHCVNRDYSLFIVSGTPQNEMRHIAQQRNIAHHFLGIFGSPQRKADHLRHILNEYSLTPHEVAFIGDAMTDFRAAKETGIHFVARGEETGPWTDLGISPIDALTRLPGLLDKIDKLNPRSF